MDRLNAGLSLVAVALLGAVAASLWSPWAECRGETCLPVASPEEPPVLSAAPLDTKNSDSFSVGSGTLVATEPEKLTNPAAAAQGEPAVPVEAANAETEPAQVAVRQSGEPPASAEGSWDELPTPTESPMAGSAAQERWAELSETVLWEADDQRRRAAVQEVSHSRTKDMVDLLSQVANTDPDQGIRYQALRALWNAAADGVEDSGLIEQSLRQALEDDDQSIANLAQQALDDLAKLEERRDGE